MKGPLAPKVAIRALLDFGLPFAFSALGIASRRQFD